MSNVLEVFMADEKAPGIGECVIEQSNSDRPEEPRSPGAKSTNGDHEYVVLAPPDIESDSGSAVSVSSIDKSKSLGSSVSSFADVIIPEMEATLEKGPTEKEVQDLVEDAKKDFMHSSAAVEEVNSDAWKATERHVRNSLVVEGHQLLNTREDVELSKQGSSSNGQSETPQVTSLSQLSSEGAVQGNSSTQPSQSDKGGDGNAIIFDGITYLGSSTVNAPVSEIELKRTMAVLREQTEVTIDVLLYVGSTSDGMIRLKDPETHADIATYHIQRILFCGRGDAEGNESDCFAFNTIHGDSDIFHCHVFRCMDPEKVKMY